MKAELEKISNQPTQSFYMRHVVVDKRLNFKNSFHYHPEYELIYTITSSGKRFIGNHVNDYSSGELIFIGKNIPHCWITNEPSDQIVIQMREDFLGTEFINSPECLPIRKLFDDSKHGLIFSESATEKVLDKIVALSTDNSFRRLLILLEIFYDLADSSSYQFLSTDVFPTTDNEKEFHRIHTLFHYIHENYKNNISLDEAASLLNLTKSSLCKFIKHKTKKTFSKLVEEIRMGHVTELLIETDLPVYQICYDCGFNDPSYFFKSFNKLTGQTPKQFRDSYN